MSKINELEELIENKNEALKSAIKVIQILSEECTEKTCDVTSEPPYHWRGCSKQITPLLENLNFVMESK